MHFWSLSGSCYLQKDALSGGEECRVQNVLCTQVSTGQARKVKHTGIFQRKEILNLSSSRNAGNGCGL